MDQRISDLYVAAGIDITSLEHRLRMRWNGSTPEVRKKFLKICHSEEGSIYCRWDSLPEPTRNSIVRILKVRKKRKQYSEKQKREAQPITD